MCEFITTMPSLYNQIAMQCTINQNNTSRKTYHCTGLPSPSPPHTFKNSFPFARRATFKPIKKTLGAAARRTPKTLGILFYTFRSRKFIFSYMHDSFIWFYTINLWWDANAVWCERDFIICDASGGVFFFVPRHTQTTTTTTKLIQR